MRFWQQVAEHYLTGLCHLPEDAGRFDVEPPSPADCARLILAAPEAGLRDAGLVITTYAMLVRQTWLAGVAWRFVILDEAQAVKNPSTR